MQEVVYHTNFKLEDNYWWFTARSMIVRKVFSAICKLPPDSTILDVGCGTGGFARDIMNEGYRVIGLDTSETALNYAKIRGIEELHQSTLDEFDPRDKKIDAVTILDVIEHIDDDKSITQELARILDKGKWIIATVPAYQWLWSSHDEVHMHYRRYTKNNFKNLLKNAGFEIEFASYYNTFLFLPAVMMRIKEKIFKIRDKEQEPVEEVSFGLNKIFHSIFASERNFLPSISFPFGLSIIVVARKK